jgi:2-polyprenyl-3-methyl-5-hydroxy-6-metoxy-1,4-benzoquinol methylase
MASQWDLIADVIPTDQAIQVNETFHIAAVAAQLGPGAVVVELGCGDGRGRRKWHRAAPTATWIGVDIASSPEVDARAPVDAILVTYDGVRLPFADASVDCISCQQVLEHVRHPEQVLTEAARVLKPGASMIGTTSNLEPYHSYSLWNFTLYGFVTIARDAGLEVREVRPGIDGPTLIERQMRNRPPEMSKYFSETSPRNAEIIEWGKQTKRNAAVVNNRMLQFCGHFAFHLVRP